MPFSSCLPCFIWSGVPGLDQLLPEKEVEEGLHAALAETSLMLHMDGDLVRNDSYLEKGKKTKNSYYSKRLEP